MRRVTGVIYESLWHQRNTLFAHRYLLIPLYPVVPFSGRLFKQYKTVSIQPHKTISWCNPAVAKYQIERVPYVSIEYSDNDNTPDFTLTDRQHTSINSRDEDTSSSLMLDISQQSPTWPKDETNSKPNDTIPPTVPRLGATSFQTPAFFQSPTVQRPRRQPVKDYRMHKPLPFWIKKLKSTLAVLTFQKNCLANCFSVYSHHTVCQSNIKDQFGRLFEFILWRFERLINCSKIKIIS